LTAAANGATHGYTNLPDNFQYAVFLSHSAKDKAVVRPLPERLRKDGLKVWFDEWEIKPGDSIPAKIEEGLEHLRVLTSQLCRSPRNPKHRFPFLFQFQNSRLP
jgi:hypothetical protein